MAGSVQLFLTIRRFYYMLGIDLSQVNQKWGLNWRNVVFLYTITQMFVSTAAYCIYEANTLYEYGCCTYICVTEVAVFITYLLQKLKMVKRYEWIAKFEGLIDTRK